MSDDFSNNDNLYTDDQLDPTLLDSVNKAMVSPDSQQSENANLNQQSESKIQPQDNIQDESPKTEELSDDQSWIESSKTDLPGQLALDIYETKANLLVICRVAGVDENNIDVSISADNILNIRGTLISPIKESVDSHFIQECYWGEFSRSISLPIEIKKDHVEATLESGILKIVFEKINPDSVKKINILSK